RGSAEDKLLPRACAGLPFHYCSTIKIKSRHALKRDGSVAAVYDRRSIIRRSQSAATTDSVRGYRTYWLAATTWDADFVTSIRALTFWICAACFFNCAVRFSICFCCSCTLACCLRNSLSNMALT